jgi:hypothetical protein
MLSAEDVRLLAGACVAVVHAYLSRGPSSTLATLNERQAIERLQYVLEAKDRELAGV